jgi:cation diffusion facilitator CzcD-associated flavoprotein CzcO
VERYLNAVCDHLDLRKHIELNTRVTTAHWDATQNTWTVTTSKGETYTANFLVTATGPLATPLKPPFPGLDSYKGEWYQTGLWPKEKIDFAGKRVGVVGTGATAVQVIPIVSTLFIFAPIHYMGSSRPSQVAHNAKSLTVFQRTPNFVLPARNYPLTDDQQAALKRDCETVLNRARTQSFGMDMVDATLKSTDLQTEAEIQRVLEYGWEIGGFRFVFETFGDMLTDLKCNETAGEFVRNKIRSVVKDPKTAELLCPYYTILSKRPPLGHFYYEAFNRPNVQLVDVKNDPITAITPNGLRTGSTEYEFDMLIFAIGFDAITGTLAQIDIRGSDDKHLGDQLEKDLSTAYGITVPNFPNLFMVSGPQAPFANLPVIIDNTVSWIGQALSYMRDRGHQRVDTKPGVADNWSELVDACFQGTVLPQGAKDTRSWYIGANVGDKTVRPLFYFGGVKPYFEYCDKEINEGFPGFVFSGEGAGNVQARL